MHRGIMVYGPEDCMQLAILMRKFGDHNSPSELVLCHRYPAATSAGLMINEITSAIQDLECSIGKDFNESFIVMPEADATPPWHVDFGPASYVLTYKKDDDYRLYAVHHKGLYDWWEPGGRWATYLKANSDDIKDAHATLVVQSLEQFAMGVPRYTVAPNTWFSLSIADVDWKKVGEQIPDCSVDALSSRKQLAEKGVSIPTFREYFHQLYPGLRDQVAPELIDGYVHARQFDTYMKYRKMIDDLRVEHKLKPNREWSMEEYRWSDAMLERLAPLRCKTLSCWIIGGQVYDLDDLMATEEYINQGLDALEALSASTIVTVVDVHY